MMRPCCPFPDKGLLWRHIPQEIVGLVKEKLDKHRYHTFTNEGIGTEEINEFRASYSLRLI